MALEDLHPRRAVTIKFIHYEIVNESTPRRETFRASHKKYIFLENLLYVNSLLRIVEYKREDEITHILNESV